MPDPGETAVGSPRYGEALRLVGLLRDRRLLVVRFDPRATEGQLLRLVRDLMASPAVVDAVVPEDADEPSGDLRPGP